MEIRWNDQEDGHEIFYLASAKNSAARKDTWLSPLLHHGTVLEKVKMNRFKSRKLVLLCCLASLCTPTLKVNAMMANYRTQTTSVLVATYAIYVYEGGIPVLWPDAFILGGGVYTDSGWVGTFDATTGQIYSGSLLVGYAVPAN